MRIFCGLLLFSAFVALASPYGYRYSRNPNSGQCQLQLSVPGGGWTGQQYYYVYPGTNYGYYTYGKYGSSLGTGTKYFGAAAEYNAQAGVFQGSKISSDKNNYGGEKYEGSSGGAYESSSGGYGSTSHSNGYEGSVGNKHGSSNYGGGYESSSAAHGGNSGGSYGASSGSNYESSSNNAGSNYNEPAEYEGGGGGNNYGNGNKYGASSSSSYGSSFNGGSYEANDRDGDRNYGSSGGSSTNSGSNYGGGGARDRDRDRNTPGNNYGSSSSSSSYNNNRNTGSKYGGSSGSSSELDRDRGTDNYGSSGYDRENEDGYTQSRPQSSSYGSSSSSSSKYGSSNSPSGNRGSSGSSYDRESSSSSSGNRGGGGGSSSYGSSSGSEENYGGGDRNWSKQKATVTDSAKNGEYLKKEFASEVLKAHNSFRARHTTPPVTLDEQMSIKAQEWAYDLASARVPYGPSPEAVEGTYGESLQIVNDPLATGREVVASWYDEKYNYNFGKPELVKRPESKSNSHFTAIVWKSTKRIGVGTATSSDGRTFVVVNYYPPGNIVDVLEDNVLPPRGGGE